MLNDESYFNREKLVDEVLTSEPVYSLSDNFANVVARKVERQSAWNEYIREFLIYLGVLAGIAAVMVAMAFLWYEADWKESLSFLISNISWIAGINLLVVFILFADRVLLRYFMNHPSGDKSQVY
jgi:hypothetical protein